MSATLHTLHNDFWQIGVLPGMGGALAFGRVQQAGAWRDVLRPTAEADYTNPSRVSSFIMLPWCNRIRDAVLRFEGQAYQLQAAPEDGTARHGVMRTRAWQIDSADETHILMSFRSAGHDNINFPFNFSATAEYRLEGQTTIWRLSLTNEDSRRFPGGFGHHPYFVRSEDVEVRIPCEAQFELEKYLAFRAADPIEPRNDFRQMRPLGDGVFNDLLTQRQGDAPIDIHYPSWNLRLQMTADPIYEHILLYTPDSTAYAVEPMTNANDGFNLYERGIPGSGVFVLEPGETARGEMTLSVI